MKRVRQASATATLLLLASAVAAHAECAWVLWHGARFMQGSQEKDWTILGALPTHDKCQSSHRLTLDHFLKKVRDNEGTAP